MQKINRPLTARRIRTQLEKRVGRVPDDVWESQELRNRLPELQQYAEWNEREMYDTAFDELIRASRHLVLARSVRSDDVEPCVETAPRKGKRRECRDLLATEHREALSQLIAAIARQRDDVRQFRQDVLGGRRLKLEEIEPWIQQHVPDPKEVQRLLAVPLPTGTSYRPDTPSAFQMSGPKPKAGEPIRYRIDPPLKRVAHGDEVLPPPELYYPKAGSIRAEVIWTGRRGILRWLATLSSGLAFEYQWTEPQATFFVLTDISPLLLSTITPNWKPEFPALTRIQIRIDLSMTARELYHIYGSYRARLLGGRKFKLQGKKHLRLATFAAAKGEMDRHDMAAWNRQFPMWRYSRFAQFNHDAKVAQQRLLLGSGLPELKVIAGSDKTD